MRRFNQASPRARQWGIRPGGEVRARRGELYSRARGSYLETMSDQSRAALAELDARIQSAVRELGVPENLVLERRQCRHADALELEVVSVERTGREHRLAPAAAAAWRALRTAAQADAVVIEICSAFRSFDYQREIIRRKRAAGLAWETILAASAFPGFSEHHSGRAVDVTTPGSKPFTAEFEDTPAFRWLLRRAGEFGFTLSFPRDNPHGIVFEPWHWFFTAR